MKTEEISSCMADGSITYSDRDEQSGRIQWNEHPKFQGVYLKHLIRGEDTAGKLSCHLVKLDPDSVLEEHIHEDQWELHEVLEGKGDFTLAGRRTAYYPGRMGVIPKGMIHRVKAGADGLVLLAKFFPALV
jgi:quercetin dioxygenase-like cupin family protein